MNNRHGAEGRGIRRAVLQGLAGLAGVLGATLAAGAPEEPGNAGAAPLRFATLHRVSWMHDAKAGDRSARGVSVTVREQEGEAIRYRIWTQGRLSADRGTGHQGEVQPPAVELRRDPGTERATFATPGFALLEAAVNQTVAQVQRGARTEGKWQERVRLELPLPGFPREVSLRMDVQPVRLRDDLPALCIRGVIEPFDAPAWAAGGRVEGEIAGHYRFVLVYSPERHELYQSGAMFVAIHPGGQTRIGSSSFAVGADGQPRYPLLDLRRELGLAPGKPAESRAAPMPLSVAQAVKTHEVLAAVAVTAAERATNPGVLTVVGDVVFLDGVAGLAGASPVEAWVNEYAAAHGGALGPAAGKFLYNVGATWAGEVLPATLAYPPLIAPLMTAYGIYQLYESMASLGTAVYAHHLQQSLRPFDWSRPSLAQADRVLPTRPLPGGEIWDGSAPATRPVNIGGGGSPGAGTSPAGGGGMTPTGGTTPTGGMPPSGSVAFEKGLALRQAEHLAGMQIEEIAVPDPGPGMPVDSGVTGQTPQPGEIPGGETIGETPPDAGTPGGETAGDTPVEPPDSSPADSGADPGVDPGSGSGTSAGTSGTGGTPPASGSYTATPSTVGTTGMDVVNVISADGTVPQGGVGLHQGPPDTPPPPNPSGGVNPALVVAGVAGGAAVVVGAVALAVGGGGIGGMTYHCGEGSSWCPTIGKCCPTGYISQAGVWGAYYIPGHGCYKSAESAAQAAAYYRTANVHPCADERRNQ